MRAFSSGSEQYNNSGTQTLPSNSNSLTDTDTHAHVQGTYKHASMHIYMYTHTYNSKSSNGLVHPAILLQQVANEDASAEKRDKEIHGDHRRVIGGRHHPQFPEETVHYHSSST